LALNFHAPYDERVLGEEADAGLLAEELRDEGCRVVLLPGDLEDPDVPPALVLAARGALGPLGALVTCHCESVDSSIMDTTVESFDRHYAVNVRATWLLLRAFAEQVPPGTDTPGGAMLALTSDHTVHNLPYGATKGALDRMVLAGTHELADRGIRTNVINPGPIDTGWMDDEVREACAAQTPGGAPGGMRSRPRGRRLGQPLPRPSGGPGARGPVLSRPCAHGAAAPARHGRVVGTRPLRHRPALRAQPVEPADLLAGADGRVDLLVHLVLLRALRALSSPGRAPRCPARHRPRPARTPSARRAGTPARLRPSRPG